MRSGRRRAWLQRGVFRLVEFRDRILSIQTGDPLAHDFGDFGRDSRVDYPWVAIENPGAVAIGDEVTIRSGVCIEGLAPPGVVRLRIGDGVLIGHHVRFVTLNGIEIAEECGIGHGSTLADTMHDWPQIFEGVPAAQTPLRSGSPMRLERGAWIGNNCVVVGGVTIGERAVVAPNSVVTRDVPARTLVSGNPARRVPFPAS